MDTRGYVDFIKNALGESYYRVTRILGVTDSTMARWRTGKGTPSDETALRIASVSGIDPALVLADIHIEQSKSEEVRNAWKRLREMVAQCVLCQIALRAKKTFLYWIFRPLQGFYGRKMSKALGYFEGLINEQKTTASRLGRLFYGWGFYLSTIWSCNTSQPDRKLLVSSLSASMRRGCFRKTARTRAAVGFGLICFTGTSCASGGLSLGTFSNHSGSFDYNERTTAICYESSFERFRVVCAFRDSFKEDAIAGGAGARFEIFKGFYTGPVVAFKAKKTLNSVGRETLRIDPIIAGLFTFGSDAMSASYFVLPGISGADSVRWLHFRFGF